MCYNVGITLKKGVLSYMDRFAVFNEFARKAQGNRDYYVFGKPSQVGIIEDVLGYFGLSYEIEASSKSMHQKGLSTLQDYILNKASDEQVALVHSIVCDGRDVPKMNPVCDSAGKVFVSMPMNPAKYDCVDIIRDGMTRAIELTGNIPYFLDKDWHCGDIVAKMFEEIQSCKFLIADFTSQITGVYYEAGYARGLGKTVIHTCRDVDVSNLHFDVKHIQAITWKSADELAKKLEVAIRNKGLCGRNNQG